MSRKVKFLNLDEILEFLDEYGTLEYHGFNHWKATCPAHDDNNPSLSVSESDDGKVLLCCHAGCSFNEILQAIRKLQCQ